MHGPMQTNMLHVAVQCAIIHKSGRFRSHAFCGPISPLPTTLRTRNVAARRMLFDSPNGALNQNWIA